MTAVWLVLLFALGGAGVVLAMPGGRRPVRLAATVLLLGAAAALLPLLVPAIPVEMSRTWFAILALIGLWGAVRVITHEKPVYSALYFILVVVSVGGLLVLMQAYFLAAALLIIYGGAILVTYVFVIMLAQQSGGPAPYDRTAREPLLGVLAGFILLAALSSRLLQPGLPAGHASGADLVGDVAPLGTHLLTQYWIGVQVAGLLLLAAMVGAIAIARRKAASDALEAD